MVHSGPLWLKFKLACSPPQNIKLLQHYQMQRNFPVLVTCLICSESHPLTLTPLGNYQFAPNESVGPPCNKITKSQGNFTIKLSILTSIKAIMTTMNNGTTLHSPDMWILVLFHRNTMLYYLAYELRTPQCTRQFQSSQWSPL